MYTDTFNPPGPGPWELEQTHLMRPLTRWLQSIFPEAQNRGLEVVLVVTPAAGKSAASLIVELPRGVDQLSNPLPADYAGATLQVADVSPFPRVCVGEGGCVVALDGSLARGAPEAPVAAAAH